MYALLPSIVYIDTSVHNIQRCSKGCRGISKRVGLTQGMTCYYLKDNTNLVPYIGNDVISTPSVRVCSTPCKIRPFDHGMACGKRRFKYLNILHHRKFQANCTRRGDPFSLVEKILIEAKEVCIACVWCLYYATRHAFDVNIFGNYNRGLCFSILMYL